MTHYRYDAEGRVLQKIIDPEGLALTTSYRYDGIGRQLEIIDAKGLRKQFSYDNSGNLCQTRIDPEGLNLIHLFIMMTVAYLSSRLNTMHKVKIKSLPTSGMHWEGARQPLSIQRG